MRRYECLKALNGMIREELVVTTHVGTRLEWAHLSHRESDISLGAMGYPIPCGLGMALGLPGRRVVVLESDGSTLMNLTSLSTVGNQRPENLSIFVFDNECYEATGGQLSATAGATDLEEVAKGAGIARARTVRTLEAFEEAAQEALTQRGPHFVVAKVEMGLEDVPPDYSDRVENKYRFVRYIERTEGKRILGGSHTTLTPEERAERVRRFREAGSG